MKYKFDLGAECGINLTNGLFTRKDEDPDSRLGEEEMQQRVVFTGFGFLYY